jgi:tetratricopeptide (TPR) repeat protein
MTPKREDLEALFALDGAAGPARRIPSAKAAALIEAALAGAAFADGTAPDAGRFDDDEAPTRVELRAAPQAVPPARPRTPRRVLMMAAALVLVVGGTAAGAYVWVQHEAPAPVPLVPRHPFAPTPPRVAEAPEPAPLDESVPAPVALPPAELEMPIDRIDRNEKKRRPAEVEKEAEDLLARANTLRGERKWQDADDVYEQVAKKYPRSAAAYVAQVASAGLRLDHLSNAASARTLYQAALSARPDGPLAEEARYGLARALRALGDVEGERAALEAFVAGYPASPLRAHAQKRLQELDRR